MTISKQVALMSRLSRERPADLPHIHGFVPFDPLRQAIYDKIGGPAVDPPFAIVENAIMLQGFIGVNFIPRWGFAPRTMSARATTSHVRCDLKGSPGYDEACSGRGHGNDGLGNEPGALLDAALMKLFDWCAAKNVPIMAHTKIPTAPGRAMERGPTQSIGNRCSGNFQPCALILRISAVSTKRSWMAGSIWLRSIGPGNGQSGRWFQRRRINRSSQT